MAYAYLLILAAMLIVTEKVQKVSACSVFTTVLWHLEWRDVTSLIYATACLGQASMGAVPVQDL